MRDTIIKIENAKKKFGNQTVLNNISVDIEKGKIYGFVGRNGSGKTVLFKSICGFVILDEGQIQVEGKIVGKDIDMPDNIGLIIETPGFLKDYSAFWNLKFLAKLRGKIDDERIKESINQYVSDIECDENSTDIIEVTKAKNKELPISEM